MSETETFCKGSPLDYAITGVSQLSSKDRRAHNNLVQPIKTEYEADIKKETADVVKRLHSAVDGRALVEAVKKAGLDDVEDYDAVLSGFDLDDSELNLGTVMQKLDQKFSYGLAPRSKDSSKVTTKKHRESVYIPELINNQGDGTIYMAKSLSTIAKVRMAWDLHDDNQVVVVDDYDKWESLLGWKKLKQFPHGKNQIREQLGDQLSDSVLEMVAGEKAGDSDTKTDNNSGSRGRRTRTKPTDEILNVATSSAHSNRQRLKAEDIKDALEDDGKFGSTYKNVDMLVLFPSTTELNMSDHYWVGGSRHPDADGSAAIANCNKGTFEYLNDCEQVWHIEDYLEQAEDYEFDTNHGPVTLGTIDKDNLVLHLVPEKTKPRLMQGTAIENMPNVLPQYCNDNIYRSPEMPHSEDMLYAPITKEDIFWMRPEIRKMQKPDECDGVLLHATSSPRDVLQKHNLSSDYKLYARARLPDWDFDCDEMKTLDSASYSIDLDDGGFELVETLAKLHDAGMKPFSETPESRWSQ